MRTSPEAFKIRQFPNDTPRPFDSLLSGGIRLLQITPAIKCCCRGIENMCPCRCCSNTTSIGMSRYTSYAPSNESQLTLTFLMSSMYKYSEVVYLSFLLGLCNLPKAVVLAKHVTPSVSHTPVVVLQKLFSQEAQPRFKFLAPRDSNLENSSTFLSLHILQNRSSNFGEHRLSLQLVATVLIPFSRKKNPFHFSSHMVSATEQPVWILLPLSMLSAR